MASGSEGRPRWHTPVLLLALLLVVGQAIAFVFIKRSRSAESTAATAVRDAAPAVAIKMNDIVEPPPIDAGAPETPAPEVRETTTETSATTIPSPSPTVEKRTKIEEKAAKPKRQTRAELLAEQKKAREERRREDERLEQERLRKKLEEDRASAERARMAVELERQRLATQKAEADAAAARAAAEKAKLEAARKQTEVVTTPAPTPAKGPDVLVLVLGPGTPSVSSDQIRNVYLGRSSVWPNGTTARPMNRPGSTLAAKKFYGGILRMGSGAFVEHWSELQLGGGGIAPPTVASAAVLVAKVGATSGGFGYVMESELPTNTSGVRLVRLK